MNRDIKMPCLHKVKVNHITIASDFVSERHELIPVFDSRGKIWRYASIWSICVQYKRSKPNLKTVR